MDNGQFIFRYRLCILLLYGWGKSYLFNLQGICGQSGMGGHRSSTSEYETVKTELGELLNFKVECETVNTQHELYYVGPITIWHLLYCNVASGGNKMILKNCNMFA